MKKIKLEPMIKEPRGRSRDFLITLTIVLSVAFAFAMVVVVHRLIQIENELKMQERV